MNDVAGFTKPVIGGHWAMLRFVRDGHPKPTMEGGQAKGLHDQAGSDERR
jgi:hypothetical protein